MKLLFGSTLTLILFLSCIQTGNDKTTKEAFKKEFLERINKVRHDGCKCGTIVMPPVPPLAWNDNLAKAAYDHAGDMFTHDYFAHTSKWGKTVFDRVVAAGYNQKGYRRYTVGENIAKGQKNIAEVMTGWIKSPEHCKNLMNGSFKEIGVGQFYGLWVQDFGGRVSFSREEQKMLKSGRARIIPDDQH